jgi:UDP-glucose 4-epimerase
MQPHRYIVTGSNGLVGCRLTPMLDAPWQPLHLGVEAWASAIAGADFRGATVVHLAARAHQRGSAAQFHRDNVEKTRELALAAARAGARRLVFASSIKVHGERTGARPFTPSDAAAPEDHYGRSKRDAEKALGEVARERGLEVVVIRAPLVLGSPARGHLARLLRLCDGPWPLPFGAVRNRRSFVHAADLASAILACAHVPGAAGRSYLVAHREPFSTPGLVAAIRRAQHRPAALVRVPPQVLDALGLVFGANAMHRLTGSLEADPTCAEQDLGWIARVGLEPAAEEMVRGTPA